ncbi:DUF421 domain-containing protein [Mesobacillus harenae]|uniref:DUF421 domain-containing protein n=1 Tax=Mesobacillus harenae TaxID=2213203 RepID=UPI00158110DE|nr:DUF421 domain-containing protein [Mesobacillus harenae]
MDYLDMTYRIIFTFIVLYILCRILGKKLISQMTFFDFVAGVALGSISASLIFSQNLPTRIGIYGLVLFALLALILDIVALKSFKGRKILNDEPTLIVKNGKIYEEGLSKARLTIDEMLFQLRNKNIFYLDEVEIAFFETNGQVTALKKSTQLPPTKQDMQINSPSRGLPQTFIIDGKILPNSLKAAGKDEAWVKSILQTNGISKIGDVAVAQIDQLNKVFIDKRNDQEALT